VSIDKAFAIPSHACVEKVIEKNQARNLSCCQYILFSILHFNHDIEIPPPARQDQWAEVTAKRAPIEFASLSENPTGRMIQIGDYRRVLELGIPCCLYLHMDGCPHCDTFQPAVEELTKKLSSEGALQFPMPVFEYNVSSGGEYPDPFVKAHQYFPALWVHSGKPLVAWPSNYPTLTSHPYWYFYGDEEKRSASDMLDLIKRAFEGQTSPLWMEPQSEQAQDVPKSRKGRKKKSTAPDHEEEEKGYVFYRNAINGVLTREDAVRRARYMYEDDGVKWVLDMENGVSTPRNATPLYGNQRRKIYQPLILETLLQETDPVKLAVFEPSYLGLGTKTARHLKDNVAFACINTTDGPINKNALELIKDVGAERTLFAFSEYEAQRLLGNSRNYLYRGVCPTTFVTFKNSGWPLVGTQAVLALEVISEVTLDRKRPPGQLAFDDVNEPKKPPRPSSPPPPPVNDPAATPAPTSATQDTDVANTTPAVI
jgi:hypothetical protein